MQSFNLQGAVQATHDQGLCGSSSRHMCARAVRTFLEYGGLNTSGRPRLARQYVGYLPTIGFQHIGTLGSTNSQTSFTQSGVQPGDIAVYQKPGAPTEPGHICMWNGQQWCSDFRQNHLSVYRSRGDTLAYIYRWAGETTSEPIDLEAFGSMVDGGCMTLDQLNGETFASCCPDNVLFKGMWSRYQLMMGDRGALSQFKNQTPTNIPNIQLTMNNIDFENLSASSCGVSQEMLDQICQWETGHSYGYTMSSKDLQGYDLGDAKGHRTFGYGLLYHPSYGSYMDTVKNAFSQSELESLYLVMVSKFAKQVDQWASKNSIGLSQPQKDAITSAVYNFGPRFLTRNIGQMIASNPNNPDIINAWTHASDKQGAKYPGLLRRRAAEAQWYAKGIK